MAVTQTEPPAEATAAAPPTPETRSPATRSPATLAGALTIAGVVAWIVGIAVPSTYGEYEITSVLGLFTPLWETATWSVLPFVLFAPAALGLLAVAVRAGTAAASGALSGLGLASYFLVIPGLAIRLNVEGQPGIAAYVLMTTGSALVVAGGMLRYARAESRSAPLCSRPRGFRSQSSPWAAQGRSPCSPLPGCLSTRSARSRSMGSSGGTPSNRSASGRLVSP